MGRVNIPILLFSLVISVFFWFVAYGQGLTEKQPLTAFLTEKSIDHLSPKLFVDRQEQNETIGRVTLDLEGPKDSVEKVMSTLNADMDISVDLSNASAGTARFPVRLTPAVAALVTSPPLVTLTIEDVVQKPFQVDVRGLKALQDNSFSVSLDPSAHNATITGPAKIVERIRSVRAYADLSSINPSRAQPIEDKPLIAIDDTGHEVSKYIVITPSTITITPKISVASSKKQVLVSPIFDGVPAKGFVYNGYHVDPFQVTLIGDNLQLAGTTEVKTERIDVSGLTASKTIKVKLHPLPGIAFQPSWVRVTYNVTADNQFHVTPSVPAPSNTQAHTSTTGSNSSP